MNHEPSAAELWERVARGCRIIAILLFAVAAIQMVGLVLSVTKYLRYW